MSAEARTIRVSGLPVDGSEGRLIDKLQIHFLRKKNSGGEISSVMLSKTMPGTAFITFEEHEVASRLAQKGKQVFKVNEKSYVINISLRHGKVDADKVLLCMTVVVDHKMLPGGKNSLLFLRKSFPGVDLVFDDQKDLYTLTGYYSEVQSLSSLLLESLEKQDQSSGDKPQPKTESKKMYNSPLEESANSHLGANEETGVVKCTMRKGDLKRESWKKGLPLPGGYNDPAPLVASLEDKWDSEPHVGPSIEDFSLIVDSDIFRYLHQYCSKEYQGILKRHGVEVLDVSCDDIMTLYLKPKAALSEHGMSSVQKAHKDLAHLYEQKESHLRKERVYKRGISEKELAVALESLRKRLPKLMISEEDRNVYMVGSKSDVSEAKQFISDMRGSGLEKAIHSDNLFDSNQPTISLSKQRSLVPSERSGIPAPSFQDSDDLFMPKNDLKNANHRKIPSENFSNKGHNSVELKTFDDYSPTGHYSFPSQRMEKPTEDIFSLSRTEASQQKHVPSDLAGLEGGHLRVDRHKYTDSFSDSSKPSALFDTVLGVNVILVDKADLNAEMTKHQKYSDITVTGSETQMNKSGKGYKTKLTETGKERKLAANFSTEISGSVKELTFEGTNVKERKFPDSGQPQSLPIIKPSMKSNLDLNTSCGSASAKTSTSKTQELKGDMSKLAHFSYDRKPTMTLACLSEDQSVKIVPTVPTGSSLRRSNSLSGRLKKGEETTPVAVDPSAGQKGISQNFQTREIVAIDLVLSFRLWLYLRSVYNTEIDNLTSDLKVSEKLGKDDITLSLIGVDSEKVAECHNGLKSLIATAGTDFDARTLPLSRYGVTDAKNKTLLELCTFMMQRFKMAKILVLSNDMMVLGPKSLCDEIEATMTSVFHKTGNTASSELEYKKSSNPDSFHASKAPDRDLKSPGDQLMSSANPHGDIVTKDLYKTSDQNVARSSNSVPQVLPNQTRANQEQDHESGSQTKMREEKLEQLDKKDPTLMLGDGEATLPDSIITLYSKDKADGKISTDNTSITAQSEETFTGQTNPGISLNRIRDSQGSEPKNDILGSQASGNHDLLLCYVCEKEYDSVRQAECGYNFCPECDKDVHNNCKTCTTSGIKGTMCVQDSTLTIPGFNRHTALKIIYDIPDGIQGEDHPCPGAPFKGNRFEAYLPNTEATRKLLPLLEKALHKRLTFTVKVGSSGDGGSQEGRVVWGSIPHKTRTEGGASANGYPDFNYIKLLEEALKAAGV